NLDPPEAPSGSRRAGGSAGPKPTPPSISVRNRGRGVAGGLTSEALTLPESSPAQDPHHPGPLLPSPPSPLHREKREKGKKGRKGQQGQQGRTARRPSRVP